MKTKAYFVLVTFYNSSLQSVCPFPLSSLFMKSSLFIFFSPVLFSRVGNNTQENSNGKRKLGLQSLWAPNTVLWQRLDPLVGNVKRRVGRTASVYGLIMHIEKEDTEIDIWKWKIHLFLVSLLKPPASPLLLIHLVSLSVVLSTIWVLQHPAFSPHENRYHLQCNQVTSPSSFW